MNSEVPFFSQSQLTLMAEDDILDDKVAWWCQSATGSPLVGLNYTLLDKIILLILTDEEALNI